MKSHEMINRMLYSAVKVAIHSQIDTRLSNKLDNRLHRRLVDLDLFWALEVPLRYELEES